MDPGPDASPHQARPDVSGTATSPGNPPGSMGTDPLQGGEVLRSVAGRSRHAG